MLFPEGRKATMSLKICCKTYEEMRKVCPRMVWKLGINRDQYLASCERTEDPMAFWMRNVLNYHPHLTTLSRNSSQEAWYRSLFMYNFHIFEGTVHTLPSMFYLRVFRKQWLFDFCWENTSSNTCKRNQYVSVF